MNQRVVRAVILLLAVAFAATSFMPEEFGGFDASDFPVVVERWPAQPAGWAFSIWGLIYLALIATAAWAVWKPQELAGWDRAALPLGISMFIGIFWIAVAQDAPLMATVMIVPMAIGAIVALLRVGKNGRERLAIGLYAGWLTAATCVAIAAVLSGYGLASERMAAVLMILVALGVGLSVANLRRNALGYRAAIIWALTGIIAANVPVKDWLIVGLCVVGIAAFLLLDRVVPKRLAEKSAR